MRLVAFTRQGFEDVAVKELTNRTRVQPLTGAHHNALAVTHVVDGDLKALARLRAEDFVFARELVLAAPLVTNLPETDRITPLIEALGPFLIEAGLECIYRDIVVTFPDSDKTKVLSKFCVKFAPVFESKLKKMGFKKVFSRKDVQTIYVVFLSYEEAYVGFAMPPMRAPWPGGVAHMKFQSGAPSRSSLKLEEAFQLFLSAEERKSALKQGMSAVDLGAAPGGWTHGLVNREIYVTAVDNGELAENLRSSDFVVHKRGDAFKFLPKMPVDWLVCDVVENPFRIADLVCEWIQRGLFRYAIVNLKLPMKDRLACIIECRERIAHATKAPLRNLRMKHLYHDRDEVTVFIERKILL